MSNNLLRPSPDRHWTIGPYEVEMIRLGTFGMDGGAMFGIVPKPLWEKRYPGVDEQNRILFATYCILIRGNGLTIVADAGIGDKFSEKMRKIYGVQQGERALPRALQARGIAVEDVTHFILTHLHFDHCGGATEFGPKNRIQPVFPKAKHLVQAAHLAWANGPSDKDKASFFPENWDSIVDAGLLEELTGETALAPGIDLRVAHGHTPGLMMPLIHDDSKGVLFSIDMFPTAAHLPPHYVPALDNHPLATLDEKRLCLEEVAAKNWVLAWGHDAYTSPRKVLRDERGRWSLGGNSV